MKYYAAFFALSLLASPALAQSSASTAPAPTFGAVIDACQPEIKTLCSSEPFGEGHLMRCFKNNQDKLSESCKTVSTAIRDSRRAQMQTMRPAIQKMREACAADAKTFCNDTSGKGNRGCLRNNRDKLSESCRSAMDEVRQMRKDERADKKKN